MGKNQSRYQDVKGTLSLSQNEYEIRYKESLQLLKSKQYTKEQWPERIKELRKNKFYNIYLGEKFQYKLGKIRNKYLILEILAYSGDYSYVNNKLLWLNRMTRVLIIKNRQAYLRIVEKRNVPGEFELATQLNFALDDYLTLQLKKIFNKQGSRFCFEYRGMHDTITDREKIYNRIATCKNDLIVLSWVQGGPNQKVVYVLYLEDGTPFSQANSQKNAKIVAFDRMTRKIIKVWEDGLEFRFNDYQVLEVRKGKKIFPIGPQFSLSDLYLNSRNIQWRVELYTFRKY